MLTPQHAKALRIDPHVARIVNYVISRASDEFGFPVSIEFLQRKKKTTIHVDLRAWFAVALKEAGADDLTLNDFRRVLGFESPKSVSQALYQGRRRWTQLYWRGYRIRWDADRRRVLDGVAA